MTFSFTDSPKQDGVHWPLAAYFNEYEAALQKLGLAGLLAGFANVETLTNARVLVDADLPIQRLTPSGADRPVNLPDLGGNNHPFYIVNPSGSSYRLIIYRPDGGVLSRVAAGQDALFISDGSSWRVVNGASKQREILTANRTYYVRIDGNDANDGLSNTADGAFLTIQKALDVASALDFSIYDVTVSVGDGTRTSGLLIKPWQGSGTLTLLGNESTPANNVISVTGGDCISVYGALPNTFAVRGFRLQTTTSGSCLVNTNGGTVSWRNVEFGNAAFHHLNVAGGYSVIIADGNYSIVGSPGIAHADISAGGRVIVENRTVTLTGAPDWPLAFCHCWRVGIGLFYNTTFSGDATGKRYIVTTNALIDTIGGGEDALPGDESGAKASGGQYV